MFLPAWAVDGSKVPASMARRETYRANNGNGGITNAGDLQVVALPVPGGAVRVMPGSATILNTYAGGDGQAYGVANDAAFDLAVPATGSGSGATRYVIIRIDDPEFGGQTPSDPLTAPYNYPTLVSSITGLTYPFEVLAKIVQPASTATITQSLITPLAEVANPQVWYEQYAYNLSSSGGEELTVGTGNGELYPNVASQEFLIPEWATQMSIIATWSQVLYRGGDTTGNMWVEFGPYEDTSKRKYGTQEAKFDASGGTNSQRVNWICPDTVDIDQSIRGTTQLFMPKARLSTGSAGARPKMDGVSGVIFQIYFREVPAQKRNV